MTTYDRPFGRNFEDFEVGDVYRHWPGKTITEYDDHLFCMITMNHHPLHTNDWYAERSPQGKNVVVGNLVYSVVLGMSVPDVSGAAIANLEVETLKHSKPTFHGDTIYAETHVLDKKLTSKGDRGIVTVETKGINQRGEEVCYFRRKVMVWTAETAPAASAPTARTSGPTPRAEHRRLRGSEPPAPDRANVRFAVGINEQAESGFGRGAATYERGRPVYPHDAIDVLVARARDRTRIVTSCDLAAGTGKLTRLLVPTGADVVAVEPVAAMRDQLRAAVPGVEVLDGTAEAHPARRRQRRRRDRRRRRSTGSTRRPRSPRSPGCCAPAAASA